MSEQNQYKFTHKLAKLIMALGVIVLLYLDGALSIYSGAIVVIWVFGTNPIAYVIESIAKFNHKHDIF